MLRGYPQALLSPDCSQAELAPGGDCGHASCGHTNCCLSLLNSMDHVGGGGGRGGKVAASLVMGKESYGTGQNRALFSDHERSEGE